MSTPEAALINRFYEAFSRGDWATMAACYHADAQFSDPVFPALAGRQPAAMWRMLLEGAKSLEIVWNQVEGGQGVGRAHWEAKYPFSQTGRQVHNRIDAEFVFKDGLILRHTDTFDLWAWSRMALGPVGMLLGWSPIIRNKVRKMAGGRLAQFIERHPEYR
ncbi:MAG: nuclear transport factor 2 family protein [Burkholderiales bacterium]|nr:nuclear transport factor 2 family protein [Burkholderiales bacterium]